MQCQCCRGSQDKYFCQACVQRGIDQQRSLKAQLVDQINVVTRRCAVQEQAAARWRTLRAEVAAKEQRVAEMRRLLETTSNTKTIRVELQKSEPLSKLEERIRQVKADQLVVDRRVTAARRVLVLEAAAIMGLERGRIAGLVLPNPKEMKVQHAATINAALQHTCHLVDLLTRYLFIALPFEPTKGRIKPNLPFVGTTKFRDKNTLALGRKHQRTFYTSYALLSHSVAYLAWMQGIEEADLSSNLYSLVHSPLIGEKSHLGVRSLGFSLDVNDVVERVLEECGLDEEGWALVNA